MPEGSAPSFHDNNVHGFFVREGEHGAGELVLDIDHIVEWRQSEAGSFSFVVAPALLVFHKISDLVVSVDYKSASAAVGPFSIHEVHRREFAYPNGHKSSQWRIELNWPQGEITFVGEGLSLQLRAEPVESEGQSLSVEQRQALLSGRNEEQ